MTLSKVIFSAFLCAGLAACASSPSPEDTQMSLSLCAQGKALLASGKNAEARDIYLSATARDENNVRAWNGLGVSYDMLGKKEQAREAYQQAIDLDPQNMVAINNLAHLRLEEGAATQAVEILAPFASKPDAPLTLKQNMAKAKKKSAKAPVSVSTPQHPEPYADLGCFATEGLAQGRAREVRAAFPNMDDEALPGSPEFALVRGTPKFLLVSYPKDPVAFCKAMKEKAFSCVPHEKKE